MRPLALASLLLVACGDGDAPPAATSADTSRLEAAADSSTIKACDLATEAELEGVLAVDLAPGRTTNDYAGDSQCRWDLSGDAQRGVSISLRRNFGLDNYRRVPGATDVAGIGDAAVWNPSVGQLAVRSGSRVVSVAVLLEAPKRSDAEAIVRAALARL